MTITAIFIFALRILSNSLFTNMKRPTLLCCCCSFSKTEGDVCWIYNYWTATIWPSFAEQNTEQEILILIPMVTLLLFNYLCAHCFYVCINLLFLFFFFLHLSNSSQWMPFAHSSDIICSPLHQYCRQSSETDAQNEPHLADKRCSAR